MVPVAVSVPNTNEELTIRMTFDNWAFGTVTGKPRGSAN